MLRLENVATPPTAATGAPPTSDPPPGFAPRATATLLLAAATRLPLASSISTWTAGEMGAPPVVLAGSTTNASFAGGPTVVLKRLEGAFDSPVAEAMSE